MAAFSKLFFAVIRSSGVFAIQGLLKYWSEWKDTRDFQNCLLYNSWGVSVKWGSFPLFPFLPLSRTSPLFSFPSFSLYSFSTIRFPPPHLLSFPFLSSPYSPGYLHFLDSIHPHFDQLKSLAQHSPKTPLSQSTEETDVGVSLAEDSTTPLQDKDKPSPKVAGTQDPNASVCVVS